MRTALVIPTRNRPRDLERTLRRVMPLVGRDLELYIVDDESTDPRQEALLQDLERVVRQAHVIRLSSWHGCTRARKRVLDELPHEYVILLDDDAHFLAPTRHIIRQIERRFDEDELLAVQAFPVAVPEGDVLYHPAEAAFRDGRIVSEFINCACAFRMSAYRDVGGYPEGFDSPYGEEQDLAVRLIDRDWLIRQYEEPVIVHHTSPDGRRLHANVRGHAHNYIRFVWWYHPRWFAIGYVPVLVARLMLSAQRIGIPPDAVWEGVRDFLRDTCDAPPSTRVQPRTLKLFYGLRYYDTADLHEAEESLDVSWFTFWRRMLTRRKSEWADYARVATGFYEELDAEFEMAEDGRSV